MRMVAAEIRIISSMATRRVLADLVLHLGTVSPMRVSLESVGGVDAIRRIRAGEPFDAVILASGAIDDLIADGWIVPGTRTDLARSGVAVAVRAGARHPDIRSSDGVRDAVLAARSVGYSTGPSGAHLAKLFAGWGLDEALKGRIVVAPPGVPVGDLVARGEIDLGFQQLSEFVGVDGIEIVGPLPPAIQSMTTFSGGVSCTSSQPDAARAVFEFMAGPAATAVKQRHGMEAA